MSQYTLLEFSIYLGSNDFSVLTILGLGSVTLFKEHSCRRGHSPRNSVYCIPRPLPLLFRQQCFLLDAPTSKRQLLANVLMGHDASLHYHMGIWDLVSVLDLTAASSEWCRSCQRVVYTLTLLTSMFAIMCYINTDTRGIGVRNSSYHVESEGCD